MDLNVSAAQAALANPAAHAGLKDLLAHAPADVQSALANSGSSPSVSTVGLAGHIVTKETVGVPGERLQIVDEDKQFTCVLSQDSRDELNCRAAGDGKRVAERSLEHRADPPRLRDSNAARTSTSPLTSGVFLRRASATTLSPSSAHSRPARVRV